MGLAEPRGMLGASLPGGRLGLCRKGRVCSLLGPGWRRAGQVLVLRGCSSDLPRAKPPPPDMPTGGFLHWCLATAIFVNGRL